MNEIILVVDDRVDTVNMLNFALRDLGYVVMTASNGRECLDKVSKHKIDLILLDMMMPGISGETVLQKIRKDKKYNKTKIIILTAAKFTEPERKKLMREGAQGFLGKPISIEALEKEMEKLLHKKCAKT